MGEPTTREVIEQARDALGEMRRSSHCEIRDDLQALLDGEVAGDLVSVEHMKDAYYQTGINDGAEQMRERCAKVDPLSVHCWFALCGASAGDPCWDGKHHVPSVVHHTRWAAAVRALSLRESDDG